MPKLTEAELLARDAERDLDAELLESVRELKAGVRMRKTELIEQPDGTVRRIVTNPNGIAEKDEIVAAERWIVARTRAKTGLSQAEFAERLGVSKRTLQEWERGRKQPSGAARVLLGIVSKNPDILRDAGVARGG
jgi:putative transcriptional regulator